MAESSNQEQIPPQHESSIQQDQPNEPKSPVPLDPATQVDFNLDEITFKSNNEVALLYPEHPNKEHFMIVSDFISKCCLREAFTRLPNQYKEYLSEFWGILGEVGVTTFRNAIGANYLSHSSEYAKLPSIKTVREWFPTIGYNGEIEAKGTFEKGLLPPRSIYSASTIVHYESASGHDASAASIAEADPGISAPNDSVSKQQDKTKSDEDGLETAHTEIGTIKDTSNAEKEVSFDKDEFNISHDLSNSNNATKKIKLEDLSKLMVNVEVDFMDLNSPEDDKPFIVYNKDEEEVHAEQHKESKDASASQPPSLNIVKIQELSTQLHLLQTLNSKLVKETEVAETEAALLKAQPSFPNLKELPSKFKDITGEIKESKKYVEKLEIEILGDLKMSKLKVLDALPSLLHKVAEALDSPSKTSSQSEGELIMNKGKESMSHIETEEEESETDSEPALTSFMVESSKKKKLKKFDFVTEKGDHVHLTEEKIKEQKRIEESVKADMAKKEEEVGKEELIDLLGIDVVTNVYKAKIKYDKYCDKMLNIRLLSRITNYDVLTKKGLITLNVYRDDGTDEVIPNFKANYLHLSERRKVMQACLKRTRAGWTSIYKQIQKRMENLHKTEQELEIDFSKPLGEQDPLDKLNELSKKKRKHADSFQDYFRSSKRYKSSVKYENHPAGTVLNDLCLGMILFNSHQRQDFVSIEDFKDLNNEMMYTVQEIFLRLYKGPSQDDLARTFNFVLVAEVNKRNQNPLKQMRMLSLVEDKFSFVSMKTVQLQFFSFELCNPDDMPFLTTDDDSDDDESDDDSDEEQHVKKPQDTSTSTSKGYKKIAMSVFVLFLRARDVPTPVDQNGYVRKPIKSHVKVTNCVLALKVVNALDVDVGSSSIKRKSSLDICDLNVLQEMESSEVGNKVK
ncbi:hypothetical protein Tco_0200400 [Tanacetum coccineum]